MVKHNNLGENISVHARYTVTSHPALTQANYGLKDNVRTQCAVGKNRKLHIQVFARNYALHKYLASDTTSIILTLYSTTVDVK